jgi:hypothetical protein
MRTFKTETRPDLVPLARGIGATQNMAHVCQSHGGHHRAPASGAARDAVPLMWHHIRFIDNQVGANSDPFDFDINSLSGL